MMIDVNEMYFKTFQIDFGVGNKNKKIGQQAKFYFNHAQQQNSQDKQIDCLLMNNSYIPFITNENIPGQPLVSYDSSRKQLVHVYQNVPLQTNHFQKQISSYLSRKQSFSGNVVVISKIKDQRIVYKAGSPAMQISVVSDYIPWRLHKANQQLSLQQAIFLLDGACKGFRQLLHRVRHPFIIQSYMIGVDGDGKVKVWWNQFFNNNRFSFEMMTNTKLENMVKSLVQVVTERVEKIEGKPMLQIVFEGEVTFMKLQQKIKQFSKSLNLKEIGLSLHAQNKDHLVVLQQLQKIQSKPSENPHEGLLRLSFGSLSSRKGFLSSQRVILSPRKQEKLEFNPKVITKRIYRGTSPSMNQKLSAIKGDIEKLRLVANKDAPINPESRLRSSKSVEAIVSVRKSLTGDTNIPQVKRLISESQIVGSNQDLMVSRFVQPHPEQSGPLYLSRLKKIIGQDKEINSTSRSINQSRFQQFNSSSNLKQGKFGSSEKKIPYTNSFQEL